MSVFEIKGNDFVLDGKPFRMMSGAIHYFRTLPEYWEDRLIKLKACGLNTVETYIPWNIHEPKEGSFNFSGICDIEKFIQLAADLELKVILRPSPYICSEWDFGGMPAWLLKDSNIALRCACPLFLEKVEKYFDVLIPRLVPYQCTKGGPVIAMQIENEYGSYGNDKKYLSALEKNMRKNGVDVLLFTSDGATDLMLSGGTLPHIFKTANFGSRAEGQFEKLREYQPDGPLVCMEFWNGWFDHWGEKHHSRSAEDVAASFEEILKLNAGVNFYMFHGGTNFGFLNGANAIGETVAECQYQPTISSYDDDALLCEDGTPREKYFAVKELIKKYIGIKEEIPLPKAVKKIAYGRIELQKSANLFDCLDTIAEKHTSASIRPMEKFGQNYGSILYRTKLTNKPESAVLRMTDIHDRAQVFINGIKVATIYRNDKEKTVKINLPEKENTLDILVENMGRINYGRFLKDYKGITENVLIDYQMHFGWEVYCMEMDNLDKINFVENAETNLNSPAFYKGTFTVEELGDCFVKTSSMNKGNVWVNGFNLGRYWNEKGPQQTLYLPAPLLKKGENTIIVYEIDNAQKAEIELCDECDIG